MILSPMGTGQIGEYQTKIQIGSMNPKQKTNKTRKNKMLNSVKKLGRGITAIFTNKANSIYRTNLIVHDMKARYIKGRESLTDLRNQMIEVKAQKKVNLDEKNSLQKELNSVVSELKRLDVENPNNVKRFNVLKTKYESLKSRIENSDKIVAQCISVIENLNTLATKTESECEKLRYKVDEIESNVRTYNNMKRINNMIKTNTSDLADNEFDVSELNNDVAKEVAKFEVLAEDTKSENETGYVTDKEEMKRFTAGL